MSFGAAGGRADFAVVGGGIVGCLVTREIAARAPDASIVLIERDAVGSGASRRSAGLHFPRGSTERVRSMAAYSQDFYRRLVESRPELPVRPMPMTVIASASRAPLVQEHYLPGTRLTDTTDVPDWLSTLPPGTLVRRGEGCQYADVAGLAQALAGTLPDQVTVQEGIRVEAVEPGRTGVVLRLGSGERLTADRAVLAPGPWLADPAWGSLVAPLGARVKKVVALHIDRRPGPGDPVVVFEDDDAFLLPLRERGQWLFSYTCRQWDVDPDSSPEGLSARDVSEARAALRRYAPALADGPASGQVFCDAYSGNREPEVRDLSGDRRLLFAGAANGSGYRLAPAIAAQAADLLGLSPLSTSLPGPASSRPTAHIEE